MERKEIRRVVASALAAVLIAPSFGSMTVAYAKEAQNPVNQETQMSSDKEVVYVNTYSDATVREQNFDDNWKFYLGDASGAEGKNFDDSRWRNVNLPHDYSIEQEYSKSMEAESAYLPGGTGWYRKHFIVSEDMKGKELRIDFGGVYMNATVWVNGEKLGTHPYGYTPFSFDITDLVEYGKENVITVKVDHKTPSSRWYSGSGIYRSVNLSVMDKVHVDLYGTKIETPNLKTEKGGTVNMSVKTTVDNENKEAANVVLTHTIYKKGTEDSIGTVTTEAKSIEAGQRADIEATLPANKPALWSTENPNLYTVKTEVKVGDTVVDTYETEYGFRYTEQNGSTGFKLNGEPMKLKGVCMHHDQGSLGAEANRRAIERQVEILQEMGCNSIRVTHNPAADELIEICNEKGMLVIEEAFDGWMYNKNTNTQDYANWFAKAVEEDNKIIGGDAEPLKAFASDDILGGVSGLSWAQFDLTSMIKRGQNAPSIIMWSLGNEIWEGAGGENDFPKVAETLIDWAKKLDSSRPATIGDNKLKAQNPNSWAMAASLQKAGGAIGANYCNAEQYKTVHDKYPNTMLYGSETASAINSRGVYYKADGDQSNQDLTSYDKKAVGWGAVASSAWYDIITKDYMAGEYVWTGFDYLGEPTPWNGTTGGAQGTWPSPKNSFFGIVDTAGLPKDSYYFYQSQWNEDVNTLHVLPAWNEDVVANVNGKVPVVVYSDAASVELFFTPKGSDKKESLGKKEFTEKTTDAGYKYQIYEGEGKSNTAHENLYLKWDVAYEDGTITAVAYDKSGKQIKETEGRSFVTTTGDEKKLDTKVDRKEIDADGKDLAYIQVDVTDKDGNIVPDAKNRVTFNVEGDGVLVGVDNGWQTDHDSYQEDNRRAYNGSLIAIVQSTKTAGEFTVTAKADGLESGSVKVTTKAVGDGEEAEKRLDSFYMSKTYYVKTGNEVVLPEKIETRYTDGTSEELPVVWEKKDLPEKGVVGITGTVNGLYSVSVIVCVIDQLGGLMNYTTTTPVGTVPVLPETRQAIAADGTIMDASFQVAWEDVAEDAYNKEGYVTVHGVATVLGDVLPVTATVRVQNEQIKIEGSIDKYLTLTQNIPEGSQSDTLTAIWDGKTEIGSNTGGGPNPTAWTNYQYSQEGHNTAEITFEYATQQRLGEVVIHFFKDSNSATYPDAGKTEIYVAESADGPWTKVDTTEKIGEEKNNVKPYTYSFAPVTATFVKFKLTNAAKLTKAETKPCTGITEIEIKKAVGSFVTNTTAKLDSLTVDGKELTEKELATGAYYVPTKSATVKATGADNASVTVLPANDKQILVLLESEDHKTRDEFTVYLEQEKPLDPEDSSKDYPVDKLEAFADSQYNGTGNEGPARLVLDNNPGTHWHTNWSSQDGSDVNKRWVGLKLDKASEVTGIRYLPRSGNGNVTEYRVEYRETENGEWKEAAKGTWKNSASDWKLVTFDAVTAKEVRLVGVHTASDTGADKHMSVAELRVVSTETTGTETSEDYPIDKITPTAGSTQAGSNPVEKALDGDTGSWWHTSWAADSRPTKEDLWYQMELEETVKLDQLRYYPRYQSDDVSKGHQNGFIKKYKVEVSKNGKDWEQVSTGDWTPKAGWLEANFDKATEAKYVKLTGLETMSNGQVTTSDMAIAEARVRTVVDGGTEEPKPVEKAKLDEAIKAIEAEGMKEADYTAYTWGILKDKLDEAKKVKENKEATQEEVDDALAALNAAKEALVKKADKTALDKAIKAANALNEKDYTAKSWEAMQKVLAIAETVLNGENVTQPSAKAATDALNRAVKELVSASAEATVTIDIDGTVTEEKILKGEKLGEVLPKDPAKDGYTFQGWFTQKDGKGDKVTAETIVKDDMSIYAYFTKDGGTNPPEKGEFTVTFNVDGKTQEVKVEEGKAIGDKLPENPTKDGYTFKGWNTKADGTGTVVTKDTIVNADMTVYAVFEEYPVPPTPEEVDKEKAQKYYDDCLEYYKKDNYTAESWKVYEEAMNGLKAALANENISKEDLQAAVDAVAKAAKELKKVDVVTPDKDKDKISKGDGIKTGDNTSIGAIIGVVVVAVLAIGAIVGVIISKKRKK